MALSGVVLAFLLLLATSRQARRSGRSRWQTEGLLVFEQASCSSLHDGRWVMGEIGEEGRGAVRAFPGC